MFQTINKCKYLYSGRGVNPKQGFSSPGPLNNREKIIKAKSNSGGQVGSYKSNFLSSRSDKVSLPKGKLFRKPNQVKTKNEKEFFTDNSFNQGWYIKTLKNRGINWNLKELEK